VLKKNSQINRSQKGVTYCGYRIFQGTVLLTQRKKRRYQLLRKYWEYKYLQGEISALELQKIERSVYAITLHADSTAWRKQNLQRHPSIEV
jgi:hypothetical protein